MEITYYNKVRFLLGVYKKKIPLIILLFITVSMLEVVGIGIIGPYISLIINGPKSLSAIDYNYLNLNEDNLITYISIFLIIVFLIKSIFSILIQRSILRFSFDCQTLLRDSLLKKYQNMSFLEFSNRNSSDYIQNMQILVSDFSNSVLHNGLRLISESLVLLAILVLLAFTNFKLFIFFASFFTLLVILYDRIFSKKLNLLGEKSSESSRKIIQSVQESVNGFKDVLIMGIKNYFKKNVHNAAINFSNAHIFYTIIKTAPQYMLDFFIITILVSVVLFAGIFNLNEESISSTLSIFAFAAIRLKPSISIMSQGISKLRFGKYSTDKLYNDLSLFKILQPPNFENEDINELNIEKFSTLELKNISFCYENDKKTKDWIIENSSLKIYKGQMIGIIGESGSGKTTLVDIILGLLNPQKGVICFNNADIRDNINIWRSKLAYLPQDTFIIDQDIKNNIAIGVERDNIDENKIQSSIEKAQLRKFIQSAPNKENTQIGEGAIKISGGQRQRIALARAFYHDKEILILDESTNSLDSQTENEIINHLVSLKGEKTIIMITHKTSTISECDAIFKIEDKTIRKVNDK